MVKLVGVLEDVDELDPVGEGALDVDVDEGVDAGVVSAGVDVDGKLEMPLGVEIPLDAEVDVEVEVDVELKLEDVPSDVGVVELVVLDVEVKHVLTTAARRSWTAMASIARMSDNTRIGNMRAIVGLSWHKNPMVIVSSSRQRQSVSQDA
mmetsp:Transcript_14735/g.33486  ORF Transcript_14735/g.33486 Transcript_14735/m.33486 type:complete len:150 (+) Transcript_14735:73-522(+)